MRSLGWALIWMSGVLKRRGKSDTETSTYGREDDQPSAKGTCLEQTLPSSPQEPALRIPWFWTSRLQNRETFLMSSPGGVWSFVTAAPGPRYEAHLWTEADGKPQKGWREGGLGFILRALQAFKFGFVLPPTLQFVIPLLPYSGKFFSSHMWETAIHMAVVVCFCVFFNSSMLFTHIWGLPLLRGEIMTSNQICQRIGCWMVHVMDGRSYVFPRSPGGLMLEPLILNRRSLHFFLPSCPN